MTPHFLTIDWIYEMHQVEMPLRVDGIAILDNVHRLQEPYAGFRHQFDGLLISYCFAGSLSAQINFTEYVMEAGSVAVVLPQLVIDPVRVSDDLELVSIAMSLDFISAFPVLRDFITNNEIRWHPVIRPSEQGHHLSEDFVSLLRSYYATEGLPAKKTVLQYLIFALIASLSGAYASLSQERGVVKSRKDEIIDDFYTLLSQFCRRERSVSFYADRLHLSPQYLTSLVKLHTGKPITLWIEHVVMMHAKSLLKSTTLSVNEISNELNFGDASLFCRYFKRCSGITPNGFRGR